MSLSGVALQVWEDIGSPTGVTPLYISGWLTNKSPILNPLIGQCHTVSGGIVDPALDQQEEIILGEMYKEVYYTQQGVVATQGGDISYVASLSEGDSRISFHNRTDRARFFNDLKKLATENVRYLANGYKIQGNNVSSVDFYDIVPPRVNGAWPSRYQ